SSMLLKIAAPDPSVEHAINANAMISQEGAPVAEPGGNAGCESDKVGSVPSCEDWSSLSRLASSADLTPRASMRLMAWLISRRRVCRRESRTALAYSLARRAAPALFPAEAVMSRMFVPPSGCTSIASRTRLLVHPLPIRSAAREAACGDLTSVAAVCTVRVGSPESRRTGSPRKVRSSCGKGVTRRRDLASYLGERTESIAALAASAATITASTSTQYVLMARR